MDLTPTYAPLRQRNYDFLSFLSVFTRIFTGISTEISLGSIVLDELTYNLQDNRGFGSSFKIHLTNGSMLMEKRRTIFPGTTSLPELVALKMGLFNFRTHRTTDEEVLEDNRHIINSMATEAQILHNQNLRQHPNIVTLLGICWQTPKLDRSLIVPVLVLEAAELGDLETFLDRNNLTLDQRIRLGTDAARGLDAVHKLGIVHCDVKPGNILVFKDHGAKYTAKIADFGSSFLIKDAEDTLTLPAWTQKWRAPEWDRLMVRDDLVKTDIFSLGLVLWYIFTDGKIKIPLEEIAQSGMNGKTLDEIKACSDLNGLAERSMSEMLPDDANLTTEESMVSGIQIDAVRKCLWYDPRHRASDVAEVLEELYLGLRILSRESTDSSAPSSALETPLKFSEIDDIVPASNSRGTMRLLPGRVTNQILVQLRHVAKNLREAPKRRNTAAYQYAFLSISLLQLPSFPRSDALDLLVQAAEEGHFPSQSIVGRLDEALGWNTDINKNAELRWLEIGTIRGSYIAQKRLLSVDRMKCQQATKTLREVYHGFGCAAGETEVADLLTTDWLRNNARERESVVEEIKIRIEINVQVSFLPENILHHLASYGETKLVEKLIQAYKVSINEQDSFGETALLAACRSGQSKTTEYLLGANADPQIATNDGITCLHFLSMFEDDAIPRIATMLAKDKELLERRANSRAYSERMDSRYAYCDGTPLLWAVAADNIAACQALTDLGADPFDIVGESLPVTNVWGGIINWSPVHLASRNHQYYLLEIMFKSIRLSTHAARLAQQSIFSTQVYIEKQLNEGFRQVGISDAMSLPLLWAVSYSAGELMKRVLIHGAEHMTACTKTVDLLLEHGANASKVSSEGRTAFSEATDGGQPFLIKHLSTIKNGELKPSSEDLIQIYGDLAYQEDTVMFETLQDLRFPINGQAILRHLVEKTESPYFVKQVVMQLSRENPSLDYTVYFQGAVAHGHLVIAQYLFDTGKTCLDGVPDDDAFLGKLVLQAKHFENIDKKIAYVLGLSDERDNEFFNCTNSMWSSASLLQLSVFTSEFRPNLTKSSEVVKAVLQKYNEPRYLNHQAPAHGELFAGYTALHLAVEFGNVDAIMLLLQEYDDSVPFSETLNPNLLTAKGESAMDLALIQDEEPRQ